MTDGSWQDDVGRGGGIGRNEAAVRELLAGHNNGTSAIASRKSVARNAPSGGSAVTVWAALIGNLLVAAAKFAAAAMTGSSSMLSEAMHSLVDTVNEVLLLYGMKRAAQPPDARHPLGHGRELYFWSFVVAVLIFGVGAGVSFFEGVDHIRHPHVVEQPQVVFVVLGLAAVFEGGSWLVALREFRANQGDLGWWQAFRQSKDPTGFMVLFEDSAALIGIALAAGGTGLALATRDPRWDGIASLLIGALLAVVAALLARESKALLIGERGAPALSRAIMALARDVPDVAGANGIVTVQLAPDQVIVSLSLEFEDALTTPAIEKAIIALEARIRTAHPEVSALFVKPQSAVVARRRQQQGVSGIFADPAGHGRTG